MPKDNNKFKTAEWKGYVSAKLEDIGSDVKTLEKKVDGLMWKVAGIGSVVALLTTLIVNFMRGG